MPDKLFNKPSTNLVLDKNLFLYTVTVLTIAEFLSLWSYSFELLNFFVLIGITVTTIVLMWLRPIWLLLIPLTEIIWGSLGRAFYWDIAGFDLSLRMLLFLIAVLIWLLKYVKEIKRFPWTSWLGKFYTAALVFIAWGILLGIINGRSLTDIFGDSNGYYFLIYLLIWYPIFNRQALQQVVSILAGATLIISAKTILIFHLFAHGYELMNIPYFYLWVRDTKVGELTLVTGNFWRIFFQSHFYVLAAWLIFSSVILFKKEYQANWKNILFLGGLLATTLISFSRSFWLALLIVFLMTVGLAIYFASKKYIQYFTKRLAAIAVSGLLALIMLLVVLFIPPINTNLGLALASRLNTGEAAASSRLNQLPILLEQIKKNPLLGSGFGTNLTYISNDPRIRDMISRDGTYSTYAFELGWLDITVKIGIIGAIALLLLTLQPLILACRHIKKDDNYIIIPAALAVFMLIITHIFTPYLNHPLGLGLLIICLLIINKSSELHESHN